ncbi:MAG: endonuclease/exonuclease/phosphatase family protein [Pyrinomonadaceae bacterium]
MLFSEPEKTALAQIAEWGLLDAFRMFTAEAGHYSWWDYRAAALRRNAGLRIDHIWLSHTLAKRCVKASIDKEPRGWERPSDHTPVVVEIV